MIILIKMAFSIVLLGAAAVPDAMAKSHVQVMVFAAASVKDALDVLVKRFAGREAAKVVVSYAASSALARHIENGAPADLYISADNDWMDYLDRRMFLRAGTRSNLVSNHLVLIAPVSSQVVLVIKPAFPLAAALGDGRLAMADPDSVPAGKYGKAALQALGVWRGVSSRLARAENVRAALMLVARGEVPLGIVYTTDAIAERRVRVVGEFSSNLHQPIVYPAAILAESRSGAAASMLRYLRSDDALVVWRTFGFGAAH